MQKLVGVLAAVIVCLSISLVFAVGTKTSEAPASGIVTAHDLGEVRQRMGELHVKIEVLSSKLEAFEKSKPTEAIAAFDANLGAAIKSAAKSSQDVENINLQMQTLRGEIQNAFVAVAQELGNVRAEVTKLAETRR